LNYNNKVQFIYLKDLYIDKLNEAVLEDANTYLEQVNHYYVKLYNKANEQKDNLVSNMQRTPKDREKFLALRRANYNESLEEFVTNSNEVERVVEYKGHLIQKIDPIYLDPESKFVKAHFYAPRKMVFGNYVSTFWVNVVVVWISILMLFLALYYRLLLRFLDYLEQLGDKFGKGE
jgi:ABC transport system ATP-binding/permease protein